MGSTDVILDGVRENIRTKETNLANLITDAMIDVTGADIAITNGGGIRDSIDIGEITKGEIITVLPFGNYIVTKYIKGSDVLAAIESGIDSYPATKGAFPQVGGMKFTFDPSQEVGKKVIDITVVGKELDLNKTYKLATNDFMAVGGDNYTMFKDYPIDGEFAGLDEVVMDYINKKGTESVKVDGRIVAEIKDNEKVLSLLGRYEAKTETGERGVVEIVKYDIATEKAFIANGSKGEESIDILD